MDLKTILSVITDDMQQVDATIRARLSSEVVLINEIGAHIVSAGGKRLRPALVLMAARALGCSSSEPVLHAAMIEFIHSSTLLHDDVVDESGLRRGLKTANAIWGNAGAVLSGDFLYSRAFQMMVESGRMRVLQVMADATNAIAEGEVLQLLNCGDPDTDEARYLRVIELKTARLFEAGCRLGAIAAEQDETVQARLHAYGHHLGLAFQLIDDVLDYTADSAESGKAVGNDLAEGKPTLPLIHAMREGSTAQRELIRKAIREGDARQLHEIVAIVKATGAIPYTQAMAQQQSERAIAALDGLPDTPHRRSMIALAHFNTHRAA
ncbi:octaprenyl-diphosphate synthase [Solimonas aquatica]|uniref:Octaprenyl diphosphate synthase n=1 Tax=Solimonas aquatica TaxID=489703 RepID=A0A1H9DPS3_9GAMM|nr:polyprenyl synthetase family protein [Solimonas aquatica]SEQ15482.1 octaprenyl-diphosphate synthase [Solimonas aquatica]